MSDAPEYGKQYSLLGISEGKTWADSEVKPSEPKPPRRDQEEVDADVAKLLQEQKQRSFVADYEATDEEALGLLISKYFHYDGRAILEALGNALEDSNFHTEHGIVQTLIDTIDNR